MIRFHTIIALKLSPLLLEVPENGHEQRRRSPWPARDLSPKPRGRLAFNNCPLACRNEGAGGHSAWAWGQLAGGEAGSKEVLVKKEQAAFSLGSEVQ